MESRLDRIQEPVATASGFAWPFQTKHADGFPTKAAEGRGVDSATGRSRGAIPANRWDPTRQGRTDRLRALLFPVLWAFPMAAWLCAFFVVPLGLLALMTLWTVEDFHLTARYNLDNWHDFFTVPFFRVGYVRTFVYAAVTAVVTTTLAFPVAYALAFKVSRGMRRLGMSLLITPFFTSYLVRAYAWQIILANNGIVNMGLWQVGIGPVKLLNTPFATLIGYLTYIFPLATLLLLGALNNVDRTLIEAAHNLGTGRIGTLFRVVIPASKVGIVFATAFAFILSSAISSRRRCWAAATPRR